MLTYMIKRVAGALLVMVVLSAIIFFTGHELLPGNEATILAGGHATPAEIHRLSQRLGLDKPVIGQYVSWLAGAAHGNFGISYISGQQISSVIGQEGAVSFELGTFSLLIATVVGIPVGVLTASRQRSGADWGARLPFLVLFALPGFVSGSLLLYLISRYVPSLYSAVYIPFTQDPIENLRVMLVPAIAAGITTSALITQMTRSAMLEVLSQPFISAARAHGLAAWRIKYIYALKAALPPVLTLEGFTFGLMIGSLFIVEDIFSLPGLGRGVLQSIQNRDFNELEAQALVLAVAFILGNLVVDLLAPLIDRRIARAQ